MVWGALPQDWTLFSAELGLTADLLPVVSNPNAIISDASTMKALGKTPSRYNGERKVVGMPDWTSRQSSVLDVARWSQEADYGVCVQTRRLRALDVDIIDLTLALDVINRVEVLLNRVLPLRTRVNSGKCLTAFFCEGEISKRILKVDGGTVELLGNGQQFIAFGTHPSRERYRWEWPSHPIGFDTISMSELDAMWAALEAELGLTPAVTTSSTPRRKGPDLKLVDPIATKLTSIGTGRKGELYIECPWKANHSSDSGKTQTVYFPAGTSGYEQGHFKCLHAGCAHHTDVDFLDALGLRDDMFPANMLEVSSQGPFMDEAATPPVDVAASVSNIPLQRNKAGKVLAIPINVTAVMRSTFAMEQEFATDLFRDNLLYRPLGEGAEWAPFADTDYTRLRIRLDRLDFAPTPKDLVRDCVKLVARDNCFDSAQNWLDALPDWDGVPRCADFLTAYMGAEEGDYSRAASRYLWTAIAGRITNPGCKADMALIFVGRQGSGKSGFTKLLAPFENAFAEISLSEDEAQLARRMRGRSVVEIGELRGLHGRDLEHIKAIVSRTHDEWRPLFEERMVTYARRAIFIGTTNQTEFLADTTGNRRWLPVEVAGGSSLCTADEKQRQVHAFEAFKRDKLQLWAEAKVLHLEHGIMALEAEVLAQNVHEKHMISDDWGTLVDEWMERGDFDGTKPSELPHVSTLDVLRGALNLGSRELDRRNQMRMADVLKRKGYQRETKRVDGKIMKVWVKPVLN